MNSVNDMMTELYRKHYISLVNVCNSRGLNRADSEDVVSEAFYRFLCNYDELKNLHPLQQRAWLYSATDNIFHDKLRTNIPRTDDDVGEYEDRLTDNKDEISKVLEDDAFESLVKDLESKLSDSEKTAFHVLLDVDSGMSYKEISEKRDIKVSTLTSMTSRFRKQIQNILNGVLKDK